MSAARTRRGTRGERVKAREADILRAAREVFLQHGFSGAKMAAIARRAAVAEGTLYLYFRNKDALLEAVLAAFYDALTGAARSGVAERAGTFDRLSFLARHHLGECLREWRLLALMITRYRSASPGSDAPGRALDRRYVAVFDGVIREGIHRGELRDDLPPRLLRDLFYGTLEYSARTLMLHGAGDHEQARVVEGLLELLRGGTTRAGGRPPAGAEERLLAAAERLEAVASRLAGRG